MEQDYSEHVKKIRVVIPIQNKAKDGLYRITATSLNSEGIEMSASDTDLFRYTPVSPDVPNTGLFAGNLNIATTDFLITGLLVFFASAIFALFLINRKRNR